VFSISDGKAILAEIINLIHDKQLPNILALPKPNSLRSYTNSKLFLTQRNMALCLGSIDISLENDVNIR
jgi:hypothetical protein